MRRDRIANRCQMGLGMKLEKQAGEFMVLVPNYPVKAETRGGGAVSVGSTFTFSSHRPHSPLLHRHVVPAPEPAIYAVCAAVPGGEWTSVSRISIYLPHFGCQAIAKALLLDSTVCLSVSHRVSCSPRLGFHSQCPRGWF